MVNNHLSSNYSFVKQIGSIENILDHIGLHYFIQTKRDTEALSRNNTQSLWECGAPNLPPSEEVTRRTEQVTRRIQELWIAMQNPSQREAFVPCAERIRVAVAELTAIFPQVRLHSLNVFLHSLAEIISTVSVTESN